MKTALVVIDAQNYFLEKAPENLVADIAEECREGYDSLIFTIFRNRPASNFVSSLNWSECMDDSDVSLPKQLHDFIEDDNVFLRSAYSAFHETGLNDYLTRNSIGKIVLCGIDTDACLLATAFDAFDNGYNIEIKFDLTYSTGGLQDEASRILMRNIVSRLES